MSIALPRQNGRQALVTGTAGLGYETALQLARAGAKVILAGRSRSAGLAAVQQIRDAAPGTAVEFEALDLAELASIGSLADRLDRRGSPIDILVCNAGVMSPPQRRTTQDGFELQMGINHLGHFALVGRLLPLLRKSAGARVVSVTSLAHNYAKIDWDDLQAERHYVPGKAYCVSKLAQAIFTQELQRRSDAGGWGVTSLAAHPGLARTNLFQADHAKTGALKNIVPWIMGHLLGQSAPNGAMPSVYAATSLDVAPSGLYGPTGRFGMKGLPGPARYAKAARDPEIGARLWTVSEDLAGIRYPSAG